MLACKMKVQNSLNKIDNIISPSQKLQVGLNTEPLKNKFGKIIKLFVYVVYLKQLLYFYLKK